jgi:hypothetical protein
MSNAYPYTVSCLFKDYPNRTFFVGTVPKLLTNVDLYGADTTNPFPKEKPEKLWSRRLAVQSLPHLPFVLADEIIPSCAPFKVLQTIVVKKRDRPSGPSSSGQGRYGLSEGECNEWKALEEKLCNFAECLFYFARHRNGVQFVNSFKPFHKGYMPSAWKYDRLFDTEHEALEILHHALAGYQLLMALVSYGIALCRTMDDLPGHPRWAIYLQDERKLDPVLVDAIKSSPLNNFTRRRVGAYVFEGEIDASWASHITYMERARCPIYIKWHSETSWKYLERVMAKYRPTVELIRQSLNLAPQHQGRPPSPDLLSDSGTYERPGSSLATSVDGDDLDDPGDYDEIWNSAGPSGQRPGESMDDFFTRRERENNRRINLYSAVDHQRVLSRRKIAAAQKFLGGKKAADVYVWLPNRITGWVKRVWVTKASASDAFLSYNSKTRRYDPIRNCWDCYDGWAPETAPDYAEDEDIEDVFPDMRPISSSDPSGSTQQPAISEGAGTDSANDDLTQLTSSTHGPLATAIQSPPGSSATNVPSPLSTSNVTNLPMPPTTQPCTANDDVAMGEPNSSSTLQSPHLNLSSSTSTVSALSPLLTVPQTSPLASDRPPPPLQTPSISPSRSPSVPPNDRVSVSSTDRLPVMQPLFPSINTDHPPTDQMLNNNIEWIEPYTAPESNFQYHVPLIDDFSEEFIDTLCCRYGFLCEDTTMAGMGGAQGAVNQRDLSLSMGVFVARGCDIPSNYHHRFIAFTTMLRSGVSHPQLWDLDPLSARRLPDPPHSDSDAFSIRRLHDQRGNVLYEIETPLARSFIEEHYRLAVSTASTALDCYRRDYQYMLTAATRLVYTGKSFWTLKPRTRRRQYPRPGPFIPPYRRMDYKFTYLDYYSYTIEREKFFRYPHARAALLRGGIVWRLALDELDYENAIGGPSDTADDFGIVVTLPDGTELVDDALTDREQDLICGVYAVYTGMLLYVSKLVRNLNIYDRTRDANISTLLVAKAVNMDG